MNVLFIDPPFYRLIGYYNRYFPYGITALGTLLKREGFNVLVYDADSNDNPTNIDYSQLPENYAKYLNSFNDDNNPIWNEVEEVIKNFNPDVIGISVWTTYAASAFHVAKLSKKVCPSSIVVMGGPHASVKTDEVLKICPHVDYIVCGEGEITILELLRHLSDSPSENESQPPFNINGLAFRLNGQIIHNSKRKPLENLDSVPCPDRRLLKNEKKYTSEDMGLILSTRGCPYKCTYCATPSKTVKYRSTDSIIEEIKLVQERYGTYQFAFKDDSFTMSRKRVELLCEEILGQKFKIGWECNTRVNLIDEKLLHLMKKAGCNSIKVGIESGSEPILKRMNKAITHSQIKHTAEIFRKVGIFWTGYFMMGVPGETLEDIQKTLDFMYEVKPDFASLCVYEPFPGTKMFEDGIGRGLVKPDMTRNDFYTTLPNNYYKSDSARQLDTIDAEDFVLMEANLKKAFHNYNKGFIRILKRAKARSRIYLLEPAILLQDMWHYLKWR